MFGQIGHQKVLIFFPTDPSTPTLKRQHRCPLAAIVCENLHPHHQPLDSTEIALSDPPFMANPHIEECCFGIANQEPSLNLDGHQSASPFLRKYGCRWPPTNRPTSAPTGFLARSSRMITMIIVGDHGRHAA